MIKPVIFLLFICPPIFTAAQDTGSLISNRAMNLFLADRIGYYLSKYDDLSFNKNYITFNSSDGVFSLNHNFFQAKPGDNPVKSFLVGGIKANVVNIARDEIGLTIKQTWLSSVRTHSTPSQKQNMAALRASIKYSLQAQWTRRQTEFEQNLDSINQSDVPGQDLNQVKTFLRQKFANNLSDYSAWEAARQQSDTLIETANYNLVSTAWTSISAYIPILPEKYANNYGYPISLAISHTRFLESRTTGRFFLTLAGELYLNNSAHSQPSQLSTGTYSNFLTPAVKAQVIYFPPDSHIGFNVAIDQNIGTYNALTAVVGIPIVLIDKAGHPAANFQFQCRFANRTTVGLTIAVPFSKIIY